MRNGIAIVLLSALAACGGNTGGAPASVAGTWSFITVESNCPMFRPDSFVVGQAGSSVSAQFTDQRGNLCTLTGNYAPDQFRGSFRVEEPGTEGRALRLHVEAYSRLFHGERQVDGWARVESDTEGQCVGAIIEFCAKIGDGETPNAVPSLVFLDAGDGLSVAAGTIVQIRYADDDPDDVASTTFYADRDGDLTTFGDRVLIAANRPERDGAAQTVSWDTTGVPPGAYSIFAVTTDGDSTVTNRWDGGITVTGGGGGSDAPSLSIHSPAGALTFCPGGILAIAYTDDDADDVARTSLFADPDGDLSTTAGQIAIATDRPENDGAGQIALWDTTGVPPGRYLIVGRTEDGTHPAAVAQAAGTVDVVPPAGDVLARSDGGALSDGAADAAVLPDGSFYVTGSFGGGSTSGARTAVFGAGEANETTLTSTARSFDFFVARYNADGTLAWARGGVIAPGTGTDHRAFGRAVAALGDGSCIVLGLWGGVAVFAAGEPNETTVESEMSTFADHGDDIFVARYAADGSFQWVTTIHSAGQDTSAIGGLEVFPDDSFVLTGGMNGPTAVFAEGESNETTFDVTGTRNAFVARYAADGTLVWVAREEGESTGPDSGMDVAVFDDGSCVASLRIDSSGPIGIGRHLTARYDAAGNLVWRRFVGNETSLGGNQLAGLPDGSFCVTGHFGVFERGDITFGAGDPNETTLPVSGDNDVFVARYHADGTLDWVRRGGSPGQELAVSIAAHADGTLVLTGTFVQTAAFEGSDVVMELTSAGGDDMYVVHYDGNGDILCAMGLGGSGNEGGPYPAFFSDGSLLLVGSLTGNLDVGSSDVTAQGASSDVLIVKYGPFGAP